MRFRRPAVGKPDQKRERRARLLIPVGFGVVLVAVPTVFAVFPGLTGWGRFQRIMVLVGWVVVALAGTFLTARSDARLHAATASNQRAAVLAERRATIRDQFGTLLQPAIGGIPETYHLTVYGPSPDRRFLIPLFPPAINAADPAIFPSDGGVVGLAWSRAEGVVVVKGPAVSDGRYGLTAIQRRRYSMFEVVAATVIRDDAGHAIGVLGAIGRTDDPFFDDVRGVRIMRSLAESLSWIMPEAIECMMPTETRTGS